ncbi:acetyl-CoA carboxylase biotin carboxyl carrier protein [Candidatus Riesia pediculicola]|uniref:acetyl-CoA carboxylase biotin carboxyl carrier protein n=1 Tax=Candidatus Riesia pediculicola TaxID=401619 RepID=UPI0009C1A95B|nr:acetyl-CoA carboxylase biotin carboxyl carrier protein [Candidatus Riesia pediculicola]ARC54037.1 hypothetical protein AOE57_00080 [Candidatus Riesia pediculicola]
MDIRKIEKIIELVQKFSISEIEISKNGELIKIKRTKESIKTEDLKIKRLKKIEKEKEEIERKTLQNRKQNNIPKRDHKEHIIRSPIVGTFYRSLHIDSDPLVRVGQKIKKGDILCIIESMKIMNQIKSNQSGTIKEILTKDGDVVEFDTPLMILKLDIENV